jgi:ATP-dependent Clp protease ATP-binding subunit ClpC
MIRVEPLSEEAAYAVLESLRPTLEHHHEVTISRRTMRAAVRLSQRYMTDRQLPDKAIDVLDQACARFRLKVVALRQRAKSQGLPPPELHKKVTPHEVRKVISRLTAVPVEEITAEERRHLGNLEKDLKRRIIGQDKAIRKVAAAVKKSRAGLSDPHRPDAVLLFVGPTGVGKTELAKALAETLFGSSNHLITFDMSEYTEEHSVSKLLGAPPGYMGSEQEGRLISAIRDKPFSLLLFDEIEKAHARVFDILLPVFDEGRLRQGHRGEVSFKHCIIVMTSNVGAQVLESPEAGSESLALLDALRQHFRPEFINRIDEIVPFYPLLFEDVRAILHLSMRRLRSQLRERQLRLHVYQGAYEYLARRGHSTEFGVRELQRTFDRLLVNPISEMILQECFQPGDIVDVLVEHDTLAIRKGKWTPSSRVHHL